MIWLATFSKEEDRHSDLPFKMSNYHEKNKFLFILPTVSQGWNQSIDQTGALPRVSSKAFASNSFHLLYEFSPLLLWDWGPHFLASCHSQLLKSAELVGVWPLHLQSQQWHIEFPHASNLSMTSLPQHGENFLLLKGPADLVRQAQLLSVPYGQLIGDSSNTCEIPPQQHLDCCVTDNRGQKVVGEGHLWNSAHILILQMKKKRET